MKRYPAVMPLPGQVTAPTAIVTAPTEIDIPISPGDKIMNFINRNQVLFGAGAAAIMVYLFFGRKK